MSGRHVCALPLISSQHPGQAAASLWISGFWSHDLEGILKSGEARLKRMYQQVCLILQSQWLWVGQGTAWQPCRTPSYTLLWLAGWGRARWRSPPIISPQSCRCGPLQLPSAFQPVLLAFYLLFFRLQCLPCALQAGMSAFCLPGNDVCLLPLSYHNLPSAF